MHFLTGIIVKAQDVYEDFSDTDARADAESTLEEYDGSVFDYYVSSPGRWSKEYGESGVFRATSPKFFEVLNSLLDSQRTTYETALSHLEDISYYKTMYETKTIPHDGKDRLACWLESFGNIVYGKFDSDSHVFDSYIGTSLITKEMLSKYKENPDKYWLVLFDIHS